jgi:hypothetical protein
LVAFVANIQEWNHFGVNHVCLLECFLLLQISCTFVVLGVAHISSPQIVNAHPTAALSKDATFEDVAAVKFAVSMTICIGCFKLIYLYYCHIPKYGPQLHTTMISLTVFLFHFSFLR